MNEPSQLTDEELLARAHEWRRRALQGAIHARGHAHAHEAELRRRFSGVATTMPAPLDMRPLAARSRPWWQFW